MAKETAVPVPAIELETMLAEEFLTEISASALAKSIFTRKFRTEGKKTVAEWQAQYDAFMSSKA